MKKKQHDELESDVKSRLEKATTSLEMHALKTQLREITDKELNSLAVRARVDKMMMMRSVLHTFSVESEGDIVKTTFMKSMMTIKISKLMSMTY